jgi:methionyl-tRNA synthetase
MAKKYYLTTAIPYVNARPHVGHALEYVVADAIHRYYEEKGYDTRLVSGADENALKNVQAAESAGEKVQKFLDKHSQIFEEFYRKLGVNLDEFRRGSDQNLHWPGVQKLWELADKAGDIYKKKYKGLYCVGCEAFKTEKELADGKCPDHDAKPQVVEEENYFFRLSKYEKELKNLIETGQYEIIPEKRKNEVLSFIEGGLEDFSISRSKQRSRGVGVPVPGDPDQKIYVWFDALTIYMTGSGWGYDTDLWEKYWPAELHIIGKDIIRFHAVYWPAMLISAGLPLPKKLLVHGFIHSGGRKMSKSLGNVVDPYEIIEKYGVEPTRYYLLSQIPTLDDGDFTAERFEEIYHANLSNGLGNLVSRVAGMAEAAGFMIEKDTDREISTNIAEAIERFELNIALELIWKKIKEADILINDRGVWALDGDDQKGVLTTLVNEIRQIATDLKPFLPETSEKILNTYKGPEIKAVKPLFPRIN